MELYLRLCRTDDLASQDTAHSLKAISARLYDGSTGESCSSRGVCSVCDFENMFTAQHHQHDSARTALRTSAREADCRRRLPIVLNRVLIYGRLCWKRHVCLPVNSPAMLAYQLFSNPNLFSRQVIQNLHDISGAYPIFRIGGSTQNSAVYYPNQSEAIIDPFSSPTADQPSKSMLGPAWMQSFQQFPDGTQYIYGIKCP